MEDDFHQVTRGDPLLGSSHQQSTTGSNNQHYLPSFADAHAHLQRDTSLDHYQPSAKDGSLSPESLDLWIVAIILMPNGCRKTNDPSIIASLFQLAAAAVVSFSHGSRKRGNKGPSVLKSCTQLIYLIMYLHSTGSVLLSDLYSLILCLLRHSNSVGKTAAFHISTNISRDVHVTNDIDGIAVSVLFCAEECCTTVEKGALLLVQHPRRLNEHAIRQVCAKASSPDRIRMNQPLLVTLLNLRINSCKCIQADPNGLLAVSNEVVPTVSSLITSRLLYRIALLEVVPLIHPIDCVALIKTKWFLFQGQTSINFFTFPLESLGTGEEGPRGEIYFYFTFPTTSLGSGG